MEELEKENAKLKEALQSIFDDVRDWESNGADTVESMEYHGLLAAKALGLERDWISE